MLGDETMSTTESIRTQIDQVLGQLTEAELEQVWKTVQDVRRKRVSAVYRLHKKAVALGVTDLAERHDEYAHGPKDPNR
jgi:DNA integrity scanning protein DisA with diadenylate cyclase activity